jgi:hypothetical protein
MSRDALLQKVKVVFTNENPRRGRKSFSRAKLTEKLPKKEMHEADMQRGMVAEIQPFEFCCSEENLGTKHARTPDPGRDGSSAQQTIGLFVVLL